MIQLVVMLNMLLMAWIIRKVKQYVKKEMVLKAITMLLLRKLLTVKTYLFKLEVFTKNEKSQYEGINLLNADEDELDEINNSRGE